jgi:shikimate dehydrogenase
MTGHVGSSARPPERRHCAVLGSPIAHSLSPALHRAAYAELGLDWTYDAIDVDAPGLAGYLSGLDAGWRGLSLTMPLKRAVMPLLDEADPWAELSGAANTVILDSGRLVGYNTDVPGAIAALSEKADGPFDTAVVLGGGATAASVLLALAELGCHDARLLVRVRTRATETLEAVARHGQAPAVVVESLDESVGACDVLVSTIPAGAQTPAHVEGSAGAGIVFEVLYEPWPTPLAAAAAARGQLLVGGLDLLVHQAALQVSLMTGQVAPLARMRAAGEDALAARSAPGGQP